ncbi:M16 family metallopeptidase [Chelativorans xinjiangense]|uniref:M16 family metallopeptidase n=1 Tax=Chelativorans xinjiangense TaxID=2681485 RepID=UPI001358011F|nr:pitrilysin family protein [Chelativorans xinjiangense]
MRKLVAMTHSFVFRQAVTCFAMAGAAFFFAALPARADLDIVEVTSPKGIKAWLVEDQADPMVSITFAFSGGRLQDPKGKEGLSYLMASMLTEGAGDLDADAFQQQFYETGAQLSFGVGTGEFSGSIDMLADDTEKPLELLSLALSSPRFDEKPLERVRAVAVSGIEQTSKDPDQRGGEALSAALYGNHPLGRPVTVETVDSIERGDLVDLHRKTLARSDLTIGVAGAIDPHTLGEVLDTVFGKLPSADEVAEIQPPAVKYGGKVFERAAQPQSSIVMVFPGVPRKSEDYYPASLAAYILGGGMAGRLSQELREKSGLTYGAYASLEPNRGWGNLSAAATTRAERAKESLQMARQIISRFAEDGPTREELERAKKYTIGSFAVDNLATTSSIAATLVGLQQDDLGMDYPDRMKELFGAVTLEEVKEISRRLLAVEPTVLVVGPDKG